MLKYILSFISFLLIVGCNENSVDTPESDIYSGKFPNAQNRDQFFPVAENNYWIYNTLKSGIDTVGILGSSETKLYRIDNDMNVKQFLGNSKVYQDRKVEWSGYAVTDSGVAVCISYSKDQVFFNIKITDSDSAALMYLYFRKTINEKYSEYPFVFDKFKFAKEYIILHKSIKINGNTINDVYELTSILGTDQSYTNAQKVTQLIKRGVGLLQFEDVDIINGFEVLYDKRVLIDYKLN